MRALIDACAVADALQRRAPFAKNAESVMFACASKLFALLEERAGTAASNTSDYKDAVMTETALRSGMDCIVTGNEKDCIASPLRFTRRPHFWKSSTPNTTEYSEARRASAF